MNKAIAALVLVVLVGAGLFLFSRRAEAPVVTDEAAEIDIVETDLLPDEEASPSADSVLTDEEQAEEGDVEVIDIIGQNFSFTPDVIEVPLGATVRINLTSGDMQHDWVVDEFNASTEVAPVGETTSVEFVADQAGEFEYYCSVGNHRAQGMVGTLIVQ